MKKAEEICSLNGMPVHYRNFSVDEIRSIQAEAILYSAEIAKAKEQDLARHYGIQPAMDVVNTLLLAAQQIEKGE